MDDGRYEIRDDETCTTLRFTDDRVRAVALAALHCKATTHTVSIIDTYGDKRVFMVEWDGQRIRATAS